MAAAAELSTPSPARAAEHSADAAPLSLGRAALVSLSLANLLLIELWARLLDPAASYFLQEARSGAAYVATVLLLLILAAAGLAAAHVTRLASGRPRIALDLLFAALLGLAIWGTRDQVSDALGGSRARLVAGAAAVLAAVPVLLALTPWRRTAKRVSLTVLLVLSPFAAVVALQAIFAAASSRTLEPRTPAATFASTHGPRVVIAVFDELDEFVAFEERRPEISVPFLDQIARESYRLTRARYPADRTEHAMPSILTGRRVKGIRDAGHSDRRLVYEDGETQLFSEAPTLLSAAKASGHNVALAGWYHPYCRVLGDDLVSCAARSYRRELQETTLGQSLVRQAAALVDGLPHGVKLIRHAGVPALRFQLETAPGWHVESFRTLHASSRRMAADPEIDLALVHYPVPHPPRIWNPKTDRFDEAGSVLNAPLHANLELVDRSLADLVADMKASGVWDRTTLVVLADHPKRTKGLKVAGSPRLPPGEARPIVFFVRLPGATGTVDETSRPNSMSLHALVPQLLAGTVRTSDDLRTFLSTANSAPSPGEKPR